MNTISTLYPANKVRNAVLKHTMITVISVIYSLKDNYKVVVGRSDTIIIALSDNDDVITIIATFY